MKAATVFLVALVLALTASVATADEAAPSADLVVSSQDVSPDLASDEALSLITDCEAGGIQWAAAGQDELNPAEVQYCGSCSESNCQGAIRGQICHLGGVSGGWGHCNIFSGGYMCSTGGWECQCRGGVLP
jgi:hypothetical protein